MGDGAISKFQALSDQTRLRILTLLNEGELCVCDLVEILTVPQPTASRHLAYLRKAGLVKGRKDGLWMYYSLTAPTSAFHESLLSCLDHCIAESIELKRDKQKARKVLKRGARCP
jgi:ArsR family transcriptional regulator, arsenate/arsenite/antimonite-responsive transcriptional repressor